MVRRQAINLYITLFYLNKTLTVPMKWPLLDLEHFSEMMTKNKMTSTDQVIFCKLSSIDTNCVRTKSIRGLSEMFSNCHRQTLDKSLKSFLSSSLMLETNFGRLLNIPTWQSFLGKCIFVSDDIAILISNLHNTKISCLLTIYDHGAVRELSKSKIYFCELDKVISAETKIKNTHIDILAKGLKQVIDLSNIDNKYIKDLKGNDNYAIENFQQEVGLL